MHDAENARQDAAIRELQASLAALKLHQSAFSAPATDGLGQQSRQVQGEGTDSSLTVAGGGENSVAAED